MKLNIQMFGGRGASSGGRGASSGSTNRGSGSGFLGEVKGGFSSNGSRYFAGDMVTRNGKEYMVTSISRDGRSMELYSGNETIKVTNGNEISLKQRGQTGNSILAKQRVNVLRNADSKIKMGDRNVAVYNKAPKGFTKNTGATTAPRGYSWYNNNKSMFSGDYIGILVKD